MRDNYMNAVCGAADIEARRRWVILGVVYLCVLAFGITLQSVPPVLSLVMAELELSHTQGGLLMSLFALPGIVISIPAGMLADRYGQKIIGVVALIFTIAGVVIFASGSSFLVLALGRIVSGIGAMTLIVLAPQLLAQWFTGRETGIAMGIFSTGMPLGTILSLSLLSLLAENLGWRASIWLSVGLPLVALVLFALFFTPAPWRNQQTSLRPEGFFRSIRLAGVSIWIVGAAWMLFNAALISLFTFTPDFLQAAGFSIASSGFITSAVMWPALVIQVVVGYVIDKIDHKSTIIAIGGLTFAILLVLVPASTGWMLVLMLLIGVAQALVPAAIFALPPDVTSPERIGLGFGIVATCLNVGIVVGPTVVGLARDVAHSYQLSYVLMAGFSFLIAVSMFILS
ncbi:CynX/NimT family MFS transporter, partial [Chloroflexota bacterium]